MRIMAKEKTGNTKNQAITTRTANSRKTQNFASSGRFRHDAHEIHITNLEQTPEIFRIREIFAPEFVRYRMEDIEFAEGLGKVSEGKHNEKC